MNIPTRVQRSRAKGAKQPPNTKYCGRGTMYGNNYMVVKSNCRYEIHINDGCGIFELKTWVDKKRANERAVQLFDVDLRIILKLKPHFLDDLFQYDHLSCFCPLDMPCHVDAIIDHLRKRAEELK